MLALGPGVLEAMAAHAEAAYPHEACGLLLGSARAGSRTAVEARPARNLNAVRASDRYDLDPADYVRAEREASRRELAVVGIYHSHPDHPSAPSETDRLQAAGVWGTAESWSYLILEVARGKTASFRSWVLKDERFSQEETG